jgi:tetratricopeptide (TPR) repeat protein
VRWLFVSEKWEIGEKIEGRYEIHDIKRGGMGIVFLCYDSKQRMPVAIKTFQDKYLLEKASVDRFIHEASTWVDLGRHRNIVKAYYVMDINFRPYVFLEFVAGDRYYGADLSGWIRGKYLDFKTILEFAFQFCRGMMHAVRIFEEMSRPFVHRDIKPSNIMVTKDGVVKITDFGLVKSLGDLDLSEGFGTKPYMSPEQFQSSDSVTVCSDIYSFGCVLFEMVCGVPPFTVSDEYHPALWWELYKKKHLEEPPPEPRAIREDCPLSLNNIILKCLEKEPIRRYQSFKTLRDDLASEYSQLTGEIIKKEGPGDETSLHLPYEQEFAAKAASLVNLGRYQEAIECFNQALEMGKEQSFRHSMYCARGYTYGRMGQFDKAINDYDVAIAIDETDSNTYVERGNVYNDLGKWDKAVKDYHTAIDLDPNNTLAFYNRGLYYRRLDSLDEALQDINRAIELGLKTAYTNRGSIYALLNQWDKAIKDYGRAIENNPRDMIAYTNLATAYQNIEQFDSAIQNYDKAIEIDPLYATAYYNRGNCCLQMNQFGKAIEDYKQVIKIDRRHFTASFTIPYASTEVDMEEVYIGTYFNCGVACAKLGKSKEAIKYFEKFIEIAPSKYNEKVLQVKNVIREMEEHLRERTATFDSEESEDFTKADALFQKGVTAVTAGNYREALNCFELVLELRPGSAEAWNNKGFVLATLNRNEEAIHCFDKAITINPKYPDPWDLKGRVLGRLKRYEEAIVAIKSFIEHAPPHYADRIAQARHALAQLESKFMS